MGQKVHPHGLRVGVIKDWDSRWYARADKVGDLVVEDYKIREYLKKTLYSAGVPRIEIERDSAKVRIYIHCSRPGVVIGRGGSEIERLRVVIEKMIGKPVALSIVEVRTPDTNSQLVAENIAQQLERRIGFRRAMKNAMGRAMRMGARGIKVMVSGRLGGAEIARSENYHEGTIPLQTIRADIDYGFAEANTTYGKIGVKVWIYKGEVLSTTLRTTPRTLEQSRRNDGGRRRNDNRRNNNRNQSGNFNRNQGSGNYNNNRSQGSGTFNNNRTQTGGNTNRPQTGGNFNTNRPQTGGNFNTNRPQTGGNTNRPQTGGNFNTNRPQQGGTPSTTPSQTGGNTNNSNRPQGGQTQPPRDNQSTPTEGGNT